MLLRKKIYTGFFLLLLALPSVFSFVLFIADEINTFQITEQLEQSALTNVSMNIGKLVWVNKGKEIRIDGKLFDVKSYSISGNTVTLKGLYDIIEDEICKQVKAVKNAQKNNPGLPQLLLVQLMFPAMADVSVKNETLFFCPLDICNYPSYINAYYVKHSIAVLTPPPNI